MSLCAFCASIDPNFFSYEFDEAPERKPMVTHHPFYWIQDSATLGCPMCICFLASADVDHLSDEILQTTPVILEREWSYPHHIVSVYIGNDLVSETHYRPVPTTWYHMPKASFGQPSSNTATIFKLLADCIRNHPECSRRSSQSFVPTRLIDVMAFHNSKDIKLIIQDPEKPVVPWVALSHCWGPPSKRPNITTKQNLDQHTKCVPFSQLSLTFQDAVSLTADLGQRYLWIDSLCIVQDDTDDWKREASTMSDVYGNATFTISALSSADSTQGCRVANPRASMQEHRFFDFDAGTDRYRVFERGIRPWRQEYGEGRHRREDIDTNPLRGRAWALQERELSTRAIHFSHNLVLWECQTCKVTSELPWEELDDWDEHKSQPMHNIRGEDKLPNKPVLHRDQWYRLMEDYMSRALTKSDDKLPALSGLAHSCEANLPSACYLAGLWSSHLPYNLLWAVDPMLLRPTVVRPSRYRAPSWSFLSLDGPVSYESQRVITYGQSRNSALDPDTMDETYHVQIAGCDVQPSGEDPYGAIKTASLSLRGILLPLRLRLFSTIYDTYDIGETWKAIFEPGNFVAGQIHIDVVDDIHNDTQVWCIAIRSEHSYSAQPVDWDELERSPVDSFDYDSVEGLLMGLILEKVEAARDTYRRVGMIRWVHE